MSPTRTCRTNDAIIDSGTCSAQASCGNALDLGPGIVARTVERYRSECNPSQYSIFPYDSFDCSCASDVSGGGNYLVTALSIDDICEPLVTFCSTEEELDFTGRVCGYSEPSGIVEQTCPNDPDCRGCMMYQECRRTAEIDPDVSIIDTGDARYRYVICRPDEGELRCNCPMTTEGVYGDETVPSEILDVCRASEAVCPP